jgi:hypothetical protein
MCYKNIAQHLGKCFSSMFMTMAVTHITSVYITESVTMEQICARLLTG